MNYKWKNDLPKDFSMKVIVDFKGSLFTIYPSQTWQQLKIPAGKEIDINGATFGYIIGERVKP